MIRYLGGFLMRKLVGNLIEFRATDLQQQQQQKQQQSQKKSLLFKANSLNPVQ